MREILNKIAYNAGRDQVAAIEITGEFDRRGAFSAGPWYTYDTRPSSLTANTDGEYSVVVSDGKGEVLETLGFDAADNYRVHTREGVLKPGGSVMPINLMVRSREGAAKIAILKDGMEIYSRNVSGRAPTVAFTGISDNMALPNKTKLCWEASCKDGGELFYKLWYCTDKGDYYLLAADIQETSYEADLTSYPGSKSGCFHIYATDGIRTAHAKSPKVVVQHAPPDFLTSSKEIKKIKVTEEIYFKTDIQDRQDGRLSGDSVSWMLNGEEVAKTAVLETGPYRFEPGIHTFTCVATNSGGASARRDFTFEIIDDESDLPDDWSRREIAGALKKGYIAPIFRIDAPIPRGKFMELVSKLYKTEAPADHAEPYNSLTQREALKIIYEGTALIKDFVKDNEYNEREAVESFTAKGVFDDTSNSYEPDKKLSAKSALVWIYRADEAGISI